MTVAQDVTPSLAELCWQTWRLRAHLVELPSERDRIFRATVADGRCFLLKLTDPAEPAEVTDLQLKAMQHVRQRHPALPIPELVPDASRQWTIPVEHEGRIAAATLLTWLEGDPLAHHPKSSEQAGALGRALAQLDQGLEDFDHPQADRRLRWDLRHTAEQRAGLAAVHDAGRRRLAEAAFDAFESHAKGPFERLRQQVIHADLNPYNVLVDPANPNRITGLIDFGDVVRTALVCDVAIAAAYLIGTGPEWLERPLALVAAYNAERPLAESEAQMIAPLMQARWAMAVAITESHAARRPENRAYITKNTAICWAGLELFAACPASTWSGAFLRACGMED